jgi:hypothetical protein
VQEFRLTLKDEDAETYEYKYHSFTWNEGGPLLIFKAGGLTSDGTREMIMIAKFQNCRAILDIEEVEDESEG